MGAGVGAGVAVGSGVGVGVAVGRGVGVGVAVGGGVGVGVAVGGGVGVGAAVGAGVGVGVGVGAGVGVGVAATEVAAAVGAGVGAGEGSEVQAASTAATSVTMRTATTDLRLALIGPVSLCPSCAGKGPSEEMRVRSRTAGIFPNRLATRSPVDGRGGAAPVRRELARAEGLPPDG